MSFQDWKTRTLNRTTGIDIDGSGDFDCVDVSKDYDTYLHPGHSWTETGIHGNGKDIFKNANPKFYQKILNDHNNPNQLPQKGDIMCFDATPHAGYTNQFNNPYGHTGVCDGATSSGYTLIQQASSTGRKPWEDTKAWKFRPCSGWLRPLGTVSTPTPAPQTKTGLLSKSLIGKRVYLHADVPTWRVYKPGTHTVVGTLLPKSNGGLYYTIRGIDTLPGRVLVNSATFGSPVSLPIDSDATIK